MLDTNRPRLKVSRAGIVLIKSFESFRPRAIQRDDGRWVIGYGHTASAREGLTVGEQDAELLLQYDLMPVAKALNEQVETVLNQHQFDALASFAVSVGVDDFLTSDVLKRLNAGHAGEAADALIGWPEAPTPDSALRRRAAERALFVADPASPVLLSDLLTAPLPPPPVAEPEAVVDPNASRAAAVASLLGETPTPPEAPAAEIAPDPEPESEAPIVEAPRPLPLPTVWQPHGQTWAPAVSHTAAAHSQRYSPYGAAIIGPLPGFPTLEAAAPEPVVEAAPEPEPTSAPEPEPVAPPVQTPVFPRAPIFAAATSSPFPPLELTPAVEADFAEPARDAWAPEQRNAPEAVEEAVLFDEEPPLAVLRHEVDPTPAKRFSLIETGPYLIMGGLGLFACAASAAAFRKAVSDPLPTNEFTIIACVLALIGGICVGVSAWNLYVRTSKTD